MKNNWPTLQGRLNQPLTSELEALEQLEKSIPLSEYGKKRLKQLKSYEQNKKKNLSAIRKKFF